VFDDDDDDDDDDPSCYAVFFVSNKRHDFEMKIGVTCVF